MEATAAPTTLATNRLELRADPTTATAHRIRYAIHAGAERIGWIAVAVDLGNAWLNFELVEAHRGHGYMREVVTAASRVAFAYLGVREVRMRCNDQERGASVARASGFARGEATAATPVWTLSPERLAAWDRALDALAALQPRALDHWSDGSALRVVSASGTQFDLHFHERSGAITLVALADVADAAAMRPAECLAHNATLRVGALCLDGSIVQLRQSCTPNELTPPRLERWLSEAEQLRALATARPTYLSGCFAFAL